MLVNKETITFNGVTLETLRYENLTKGKIEYEIHTSNRDTKVFITESIKSGKNLKISLWINGYNINLSEKYEYGMVVHIFTDLVNQFNK